MAVTGCEPSFLSYTTEWIRTVNRGGLFEISDDAYLLFREIELSTRHSFESLLKASSKEADQAKMLINRTSSDPAIVRY